MLPDGTAAAWDRLTPSYQSYPARGRDNYQQFWDQMRAVTVSDVRTTGPTSAVATVTYSYKDGHTVVEQTSYDLVRQDGGYLINGSSVLSSR